MSYAPTKLLELQSYMQLRTGLPINALGIVGDEDHDGGYHCGWDRRRIRNGQLADYSWEESGRDFSHRSNAARAFDCGSFSRLREMSVWMVGQCQAGAADTLDIRSIIYSPDGVSVHRWDRLGLHTGGNVSHQTHTHFSFFADAEHRDKVSLFRRFFEGGAVATEGERNQTYYTQNGILGLEEPKVHIPAESGFAALEVTNPLATVLKAILTGTDANIPAFAAIGARTWNNGLADRLDRIESKLDLLLAKPPGSMDPEVLRAAIRAELNNTKLEQL